MDESVSYEKLLTINPGRLKPWRRIFGTLLTAYIFAFVLGIKLLKVGIGGIELNDFLGSRPWLSLAVGLLTGLAYPYVRDSIVAQLPPGPTKVTEPSSKK